MADQLPVDSLVIEPTAAEEMRAVNRKMALARNRLIRRLFEVSRRVDNARDALDVRHVIGDHALAAVGIAFAAGALLALPGSGRGPTRGPTVPMTLGGVAGSLAVGLIKDALGAWLKRSIAQRPA